MLLGDFNQSHFLLIFDIFYVHSALEQEHHNLIHSLSVMVIEHMRINVTKQALGWILCDANCGVFVGRD